MRLSHSGMGLLNWSLVYIVDSESGEVKLFSVFVFSAL